MTLFYEYRNEAMPNNLHKPGAIKQLSRDPYEACERLEEEYSCAKRRGVKNPSAIIADIYGMNPRSVMHYVRVKRKCTKTVLRGLKAGRIRLSHALTLSALPADTQDKAVAQAVTMKSTEFASYCKSLKRSDSSSGTPRASSTTDDEIGPDTKFFIRWLSKQIDEKVFIRKRKNSLVLEVSFYTVDRALDLMKTLMADACPGAVSMSTSGRDHGKHFGQIKMTFQSEAEFGKHFTPVAQSMMGGESIG